MQEVVNSLDAIIGQLNINAFNFWFYTDSTKLEALKRQCVIERKMTFPQFLSVFLPNEFDNMHGIYNAKDNTYEFIGKSLYMECSYNIQRRIFETGKLYEIPIDRLRACLESHKYA